MHNSNERSGQKIQSLNRIETVGIVGAGLVGSLLSLFLAKRGIVSDLYEYRPDLRKMKSSGRSINLAVSTRGLHALRQIGLEAKILEEAIPMYGRMIHSPEEELTFQRYGKDNTECIYSISRAGLNRSLLTLAENTGLVKIHFNEKASGVDLQTGELQFKNVKIQHMTLMAADGSGSILRDALTREAGYQCQQESLNYGYKELTIPGEKSGNFKLEKNALHIWPRGTYMLIALPNFDGSFTCTLFLPLEGANSFASLKTPQQVIHFFQTQFPDAYRLIPQLTETFFDHPTGNMVTIKCSPWHYSNKLLLLGDAAHAIVPFFGQGMNCGFEDCTVLDELLEQSSKHDWENIFATFSQIRKTHTDAIADMAVENFEEMRDKVGNSRFLLEKEVEKILQKNFPELYVSRYSLVTFSRVPYRLAYQAGLVQNKILRDLCHELERPEDVDLQQAKRLINSQLSDYRMKEG